MAKRYRKKPVVIEADGPVQPHSILRLARWCGGQAKTSCAVEIATLEGMMRAERGDWIIKGVKGDFYPCKPDVFEQSYEPVKDGDDDE